MAEIRKHRPATSAIGDAVRALAGEKIRPVTPGQTSGAGPQPDADPFDRPAAAGEPTTQAAPSTVSLSIVPGQGTGWLNLDADSVRAASAPVRSIRAADDTEDADDEFEDDWGGDDVAEDDVGDDSVS